MKPEFNKKYNTIAVYAFVVIAAALCFWAVLHHIGAIWNVVVKIASALIPFVNGFIIAYLINPVVKICEKWFSFVRKKEENPKIRRVLAIAAAYLIVVGFLTLFVILIIPQIAESISEFATNIVNWAPNAYKAIGDLFENIEYEMYMTELLNKLINKIAPLSGDSLAAVYFGVKNLAVGVINLVFGFVISIYMLYDKERFSRQAKMLVTAFFRQGTSDRIVGVATEAHKVFSGFLGAKIVTSGILGLLCTVSMWILRMPYAELIGAIIGLTNLIPYFGTWIGGAVCTLMIMVESPAQAIWFVVLILVLQQIDNSIISPKVLGNSTGISPFWTIFAILVGGGLFGIPGMLLGVPVFALFYSLFAAYVREKSK